MYFMVSCFIAHLRILHFDDTENVTQMCTSYSLPRQCIKIYKIEDRCPFVVFLLFFAFI